MGTERGVEGGWEGSNGNRVLSYSQVILGVHFVPRKSVALARR